MPWKYYIALLPLLAAGIAQAQEEAPPLNVTVQGHAEGTGFAARAEAIRAAQQNAVVQALEALVADKDLRMLRPLIRRAPSYVNAYSLIDPGIGLGGGTRVTLELTLNEAALRRDAAETLLPHLSSPPRILLLAAERPREAGFTPPSADTATAKALTGELEGKSFELAPVKAIVPYYTPEALSAALWGDVEAGRRFARENEADVVVLAAAVLDTQAIAEGAKVLRHTAVLTMRVYRGEDGKLVDVLESRAVVNGAKTTDYAPIAYGDAAVKAIGALRTAVVLAYIGALPYEGVRISIVYPGSKERLAGLKRKLESNPQVLGVERRFFHPALARLRVDYRGPMRPLLDALLEAPAGETAPTLMQSAGREAVLAYPAP